MFSNFLHEVRTPSGYKSERARFQNKIVGAGGENGEKPFWGHIVIDKSEIDRLRTFYARFLQKLKKCEPRIKDTGIYP